MDYTLEDHGDLYEQRFLATLSTSFPNYEIFWQRFIVPLTRRASDGSIHLRSDIDPLLEMSAMAHYSVFFHLGVTYEMRGSEFFEDTFFHLSAATEMVEKLILSIAKILVERIEGQPIANYLDEEDIHQKIQNYWDNQKDGYERHYDRFLESGRTVNYSFHAIDDVVRQLFSQQGKEAEKDCGAWYSLTNKIRHYRNVIAHNPRLGHILDPTTNLRIVPKEDKLSNYKLWSSVIYNRNPGDFIRLEVLVDEYQTTLVAKTNSLWEHLINLVNDLVSTDEYKQMAGGQEESSKDRPSVLFESENSETEQPVMPSGTSSSHMLEEVQYPTNTSGSGVYIPEHSQKDT